MSDGISFGLLGTVVARRGDSASTITGRKGLLLAILLLDGGEVVPIDDIADLMSSARATLYNSVKRLRTALGDTDESLIEGIKPGYRINITRDQLDLAVFEDLADAGFRAFRAGDLPTATARLRAALAQWRGNPLGGVVLPVQLKGHVQRMEELRLQALEDLNAAYIQLGQHREAVPGLAQLTAAHPLRERPHAIYMRALHLSGRQKDAQTVYWDICRRLNDELAAAPGPELRETYSELIRI
ncbi:AfsR/SARP family transcriptional regulator [Catenulispora yoronensis]|uniref:AfsR/SARP family transcriptional regulator n=1 Tax=Catenulispora yoronensis TaxID=450799 RepID=UPI0031DB845F